MGIDYAKAIRKLRVKLNISQTQLAEMLGVSFMSISRWENGKFSPTILAQEKLKDLFEKNEIEYGGEKK